MVLSTPVRRVHRQILRHLTDTPISAKKLARRAGYKYNSRLRQALADLGRADLIIHSPDGYRLARG